MKNQVSSSNLDSYTKWEPLIDASTFMTVGALTNLPLSAANTTASILVNRLQLRSSFQKACALITAIALSTLAFPYLIGSLSLTVALQIGATHLATKVTTFVLFKSGLFLKGYFFLPFPTTLHEVQSVEPTQLYAVKKHLLDFPGKIKSLSLPFQAALNQKFEEHGLDPFLISQFADLGKTWPRDILKWLHAQDLKHLPLEKRAAISQLFFDHNLPPQDHAYTEQELPDISLNPKKRELSTPQIQWFYLKYPHSEPPKAPAPKMEIPWKKVAAVGLIALSAIGVVALFNRQPQEIVIPPLSTALVAIRPMCPSNITESLDSLYLPIVEKEASHSMIPPLIFAAIAASTAAFAYFRQRPVQEPAAAGRQLAFPITPPQTAAAISYTHGGATVRTLIDLTRPEAQENIRALLKGLPPLDSPVKITLQNGNTQNTFTVAPPQIQQLVAKIYEPETRISPQLGPILEESVDLEEPAPSIDWGKFQDYVKAFCPGIDFEKEAKPLAQQGIEIYQKLYRDEPVDPTNLEDKLRAVCFGLMAHAVNKGQPFVEGTFDIKDPGHRLFHFFFPALYGRSSSHYQNRVIPVDEGKWKGYAHFGCDLEKLPASKRTVMMGRIQTHDQSQRIYLKMENWGLSSLYHAFWHACEFAQSQGNKLFPNHIPGIGQGTITQKEHLLEEDKRKLRAFFAKIKSQMPSPNIDTYGLQDAIPYLKKALALDLETGLKDQIRAYIAEIEKRYDHIDRRKGNEFISDGSMLYD